MRQNKPYSTYKKTEVSWLGELPKHWEVKKVKYLFTEQDKRSLTGSEDLLSVSQYTGVTKKSDKVANGDSLTNAKTLEGYKIVSKGDLVINIMLAWNGSLGISKYDGLVSPAYCVYKLKEGNEKYFGYLFKTKNAQQEFKKNSTGIIDSRLRLYTDDFFSIKTAVPPKEEQTAIARFLDYKLAKINRFIQKKKQLIKLLNEQKAAIINQAVTKGLDPNTKMKDSGIEWLGEIPEYWEVWRLKYLINGKLKYGANESGGDLVENHPRYIRITDFDKSGKLRDETFCSLNPELAEPYLLKEGDILFARSGGTVGKTFQFKNYEGVACYAGYLIKAEPNTTKISSDYLFAYTNSGIYDQWKSFIFNKATIENIGADKYSLLPVILPPLSEQQKIISHIEQETTIINTTISKIEKELTLTEEYKTALIAEAVTGKIDVRGYEVPEITEEETYEEIEEEISMAAEDAEEYQTLEE
ncbi:MAG: restriction endonuclease subunit S [Flavobacteriaceae bacterium]|nr:restriction endonuclease subunit S [Flavobacteriaceae bacterium]